MTHAALQRLGVCTRLDGDARRRVAQFVERQVFEPGFIASRSEVAADEAGLADRAAPDRRERKLVAGAVGELVAKFIHEELRDGDSPAGRLRLQFDAAGWIGRPRKLFHNPHLTRFEIDVGGVEPEQFTLAKTEKGGRPDGGPEVLVDSCSRSLRGRLSGEQRGSPVIPQIADAA